MTNSIFEPKKGKRTTKKLGVLVSLELYDAIEKIHATLKSAHPELQFNVNKICEEALDSAVKKAKKELSKS